ncbi:hypothetical protein SASPL_134232 [Salvia splendens]|uniref:TIP41-like protein n=1 Tax=Salvia splendens TaxID=180675 RepID=A0A8X8X454_SALSN|nr:hypothetical protein SASPL_134232 [Salvia splendens]
MEWESDERELKAAGAVPLGAGRVGFLIHGWEIETTKRSILNSSLLQQWEEKLQTTHLPEMVFGESCLILKHVNRGIKLHFNAFDALCGWKLEALPPVEVPAAALWKFRCLEEDLLKKVSAVLIGKIVRNKLTWLHYQLKDLFFSKMKYVVLYEDELADNGISLLTVKVLRVDGVLMRLRDTRVHCSFRESTVPVILREICWREATFKALSSKGYPTNSAAYTDPRIISERLPMAMRKTQKLIVK